MDALHTLQEPMLDPNEGASLAQLVSIANSGLRAARAKLRASRVEVWRRQLRFTSTIFNAPPWVVALIGASGAGLVCGLTMVALTSERGLWPVVCLLTGFVCFGTVVLWFLRDEPGETDENRRQLRRIALQRAKSERDAQARALVQAKEELSRQRAKLAAYLAIVNSERNKLLAIDPGRLYPGELERFVASIFRYLGYAVTETGQSGDQGVDVLAEKGGIRLAIQVKCYSGNVGNSSVQEVYAGMAHYRCHRCLVITNSEFTANARELATSTGCFLIDRSMLPLLIRGELELCR